jgi:CheY-like chemotaxis protein
MTKRALLVENDRTVLKHLARVLKRLGLECDTAEDYATAERFIKDHLSNPYVLHTVDIELGGDVGLDLIDKYKAVLTRESTAIVTTWGRSYEARLRELNYPTLDKGDPALNTADPERKLEVLFAFFCNIPSMKKAGISPPQPSMP